MSRRDQVGVVATLWLVVTVFTAYEIVPATLLPLVRADLGIGPTAASWIVSSLILSMAILSLPAGVVLDRFDDRRVLAGATLVAVGATLWGWQAAVADDYWLLLASRFVGGAGLVTLWTASVNLVGASVHPDAQATAIGWLSTAVPAGFALGHLTGPWIAASYGWGATLPAYGLIAVVGLVAYWPFGRRVSLQSVEGPVPSRADLRRVLTSPRVWSVGVLGFAAFSLNLLFNSWVPSFVVERFSVSLALGGLTTAVFPAIGVLSRASSGPVSERVFGGRRRPVVLLSFGVTAPVVVVLTLVGAPLVLVGVLLVAGFAVQLGLALLFTYVRELVAANVVGTALAVLNTVGFLGAFSAPIVAGALLEATGSYVVPFGYAAALAVVGVAVGWVTPEPDRY